MGESACRPGYLYLMRWNGYHKIGLAKNVKKRLREIGYDYPGVELVHAIAVDNMYFAEMDLHDLYAAKRHHGEWFDLATDEVAQICAM
jgi:hypothetical protein